MNTSLSVNTHKQADGRAVSNLRSCTVAKNGICSRN